MKFHSFRVAAVSAMCALLCGCGYHLGFLGHPQLENVAVAPAVNETEFYNVASDMRMMMCEAIMQDGTYKLVEQPQADCVLFLTVTSASFVDVSVDAFDRDNSYKPREWSARVSVNYKLILPGKGVVLRSGKVSGSSRFQAATDVETSRLRGVRQACFEAAKNITWALAEGW